MNLRSFFSCQNSSLHVPPISPSCLNFFFHASATLSLQRHPGKIMKRRRDHRLTWSSYHFQLHSPSDTRMIFLISPTTNHLLMRGGGMNFGTANIDVDLRIHFSTLLSDSPLHIPSFVLCVRLVDTCRLRLFFLLCTIMLFPRCLNK